MKGKMFKYICSLLLLFVVLSGNSQTINGRLYTQFNNYYKWRGGAFDSVLLLPNLTGTAGLRGGALRYNGADSSLYVYTGTQWRKIDGSGSGSTVDTTSLSNRINLKLNISDTSAMLTNYRHWTQGYLTAVPTLQQVTNQGFTTTTEILKTDGFGRKLVETRGPVSQGQLRIFNPLESGGENNHTTYGRHGIEYIGNVNTGAVIQYPDTTGIGQRFVIGAKLNGTAIYPSTGGLIDLGTISSDTATVVKAYVTNAESVTITKGQVVYIFGASGDRASVKLAKNTSDTFSSKTLGIVRENIAAGQAGWITTQGQVSGINLGAYTPGDILWLDSIPGSFTATKPQAPYHAVFIGVVERANVGNGLIYVKPANGVELDELHDVRITSLSNNEIIRYNSSLGYWENKSITTTLGYTPLNVTDTTAMLSPYLRSNIANVTYQLQLDTVSLVSFGAGSGAAGDTSAFTTSAVYGSFYNDGSDTLIITQMRAGVLGTSPSITTEIYWNDSLNITAGATILVSGGTSVTGTIGATNVTSFTNNKIPPGVWVFCRTSAVATKPTYFTLTLLGYKKRK